MERSIFLDQVFTPTDDVMFRRIADETLLVPVRRSTADLESVYRLNEVATRVWELLDGQRTGAAIGAVLAREFEVTPEEAAADVARFLERLAARGAVVARE